MSPLEWRTALSELRIATSIQSLSQRTKECIWSLVSTEQPPLVDCICISHDIGDEHSLNVLNSLSQRTSRPVLNFVATNAAVPPKLRKQAQNIGRFVLSLCHGCKVVLRNSDPKHRYDKNEEGCVDMDTKVLESNFTSGKSVQVRLCSSGDVVVVKTVNVTVDGESLSIFPIFLAYSTTVRMAQSRSKDNWPILLQREYKNHMLTFEFAQFYVALGRSRFPPKIYAKCNVLQNGNLDPDSFLDLVHLANPAVINLLAKLQDMQ